MNFLIQLAIALVLQYVTASKAPKPKNAEVQTGEIPIAEPSAPIPVLFGTDEIKASNTVDWRNPTTTRIRTKGGKK